MAPAAPAHPPPGSAVSDHLGDVVPQGPTRLEAILELREGHSRGGACLLGGLLVPVRCGIALEDGACSNNKCGTTLDLQQTRTGGTAILVLLQCGTSFEDGASDILGFLPWLTCPLV